MRVPRLMPAFTVLLAVSAFSLPSAWAQGNGVRVALATHVETPPVLDGIVNDAAWDQAEPITEFIQAEPYEGEAATENTVVRVIYDDTTIYISAICYDSRPDLILVTDSRRDSPMNDMDSFQVILDTYHDRQNGFVFGTNPAGIEYDGQVSNEGEGGRGRPRAESGRHGRRIQSELGCELAGADSRQRDRMDG